MALPAAIGSYRVLRELGRGGMGVVYEVARPDDPRRLALKLVTCGADLTTLARFRREAELLARIRHPNVVVIHDLAADATGLPYIVSDLVEGQTLDELAKEAPLEPGRAVRLLAEIARTVQALHDHDVVHRDLKPSNVMVRPGDQPILLDFGLARAADGQTLTATGALLGTPAYMAPEQADREGEEPLDHRADVYGLGATLLFALTGHAPFKGTLVQALHALLTKEPDWSGLPDDDRLQAIVRRALAKRPRDRFPSAAALADALDAWLAPPEPPRRLAPLVAGAALVLAGVLAAVAIIARPTVSPGPPATSPSASPSASPDPTHAPTPAALPGWELIETAEAPVVCGVAGTAIHDPRHGVVIYGGYDVNRAWQQGAWSYDGATWKRIPDSSKGPGIRVDAAMLALPDGSWMLTGGRSRRLSGGSKQLERHMGDTWLRRDGGRWFSPTFTGYSQRAWHRMVLLREANLVLLFGGQVNRKEQLDETYLFNLRKQAWGEEEPGTRHPEGRHSHGLAYLAAPPARAVLFGGYVWDAKRLQHRVLDDLWVWDGGWQPIERQPGEPWPAARKSSPLVGLGKAVALFGGSSRTERAGEDPPPYRDDLWLWSATTRRWRELDVDPRPPARSAHALVYDAARGRLVLFGGFDTQGTPLTDTWEWPVPAQWRE